MDEMEKEMKVCFLEEGKQLLEEAEQCFLDLENNRDDVSTIEKLFRIAHNIKGTSRAVGFAAVAEFTHEFENLLLELKEGRRRVDQACVDIMLECNDAIKQMIESLTIDLDATFDHSALIEKLKLFMSGVVAEEAPSEEVPQVDQGEWEQVAGEPEESRVAHSEHTESQSSQDTESVETSNPDIIQLGAVHPISSAEPLSGVASQVAPQSTQQQNQASPATSAQAAATTASPDESIRVSLRRLERLSDYIGELVILQTVLDQSAIDHGDQQLKRTVSQLGKLSKEIQDISLSLRMLPLKPTFAKLQRIVRDTGRALSKEIQLTIEGDQVEVDKTVLENLSDPLVHIVRNAIDHGLESTDDRVAIGKPRAGAVKIKAFHKGNNLVIEVSDDGKGVDPAKLKQKAIEKGLISANVSLTDDECRMLLFRAGFSTKDQVSEISGRGVGLDVVKTNVEKMGGSVQLDSAVGHGSVFRITLPLTLAIVEGLVCEIAEQKMVVPMSNIKEVVRAEPGAIRDLVGGKSIVLRGSVLPLFDLGDIFQLKKRELNQETSVVLVSEGRTGAFGVIVDEVLRQQQIVIKKLGQDLASRKGLVGSAILGDGKPSLILDLSDLVDSIQKKSSKGHKLRGAA